MDMNQNVMNNGSLNANVVAPNADVPVENMPVQLQQALAYLSRHKLDSVELSAEDERNDENSFFDDLNDSSMIVSSPSSIIIEDDNTTESFDDVGLF